jgi:hypothetical protein
MTSDEQNQYLQLQKQLELANKDAHESRTHLLSALDESHGETRFYQGIFWCALAFAAVIAVYGLLAR